MASAAVPTSTGQKSSRPAAGLGAPDDAGRWLALAVLCLPLLIVSLDNTVLNVVLPTLVRKLRANTDELQWIVDAYILVFAGLLLVAGSLADRIGRKRTFLTGLVIFAAGSTWASVSGSVGMLIAARASMGIGGALIMPSTLAIITDSFRQSAERQRALGIWSGTTGVGIALGPVVGGLLLQHLWWGSVFLINVPIAALAMIFAIRLVPESKNADAQAPDPGGAMLSSIGLALLVWAIIEAPVHGWQSARVLAAGGSGLLLIGAFIAFERRSSHPMLQLRFFAERRFSAAVAPVGLVMFGLFGALFLLTQFLQFKLAYTPLQAGLRTMPAAGAILVMAPISTLFVRTFGVKLTVAAGLLLVATGLLDLSGSSAASTYVDALPGMIMIGAGAGLVIPSATGSVMGSLPSQHTGVGSATNGTFLQVGGALGVAVMGSLLSSRYQHRLLPVISSLHLPAAPGQVALGSLGAALTVARRIGGQPGSLLAAAARSAFSSGMDLGLLVGGLLAIVGALIVLLLLPARPAGDGQAQSSARES